MGQHIPAIATLVIFLLGAFFVVADHYKSPYDDMAASSFATMAPAAGASENYIVIDIHNIPTWSSAPKTDRE